jgi:hypothetical protein
MGIVSAHEVPHIRDLGETQEITGREERTNCMANLKWQLPKDAIINSFHYFSFFHVGIILKMLCEFLLDVVNKRTGRRVNSK